MQTMRSPRDTDELRERIVEGWVPEFVFFLSPEAGNPRELGSECLSQWYPSPMEIDGVRFPTAEHYMMWRKAQLFSDDDVSKRLLADESPAAAKRLGREVRHFDGAIWMRHRLEVVRRGSIAKFQQNAHLAAYLFGTKDHVLAEASPVDYIWGIGFDAHDTRARNPLVWPGLNLLGFVLMQTRAYLSSFQRATAISSTRSKTDLSI